MNIFLNILVPIICLIFGYVVGSLNMSILIGKYKYHQDPRDFGSGNAGATNATRIWGKKVGKMIMALDVVKSVLPLIICWAILTFVPFDNGKGLIAPSLNYVAQGGSGLEGYIIQWPCYYLAGLGAVIGHCWPLFGNFKGGKGAASFLGLLCVTTWMFGLLLFPAYIVMKKKTKIVSFSVLVCCGSAVVLGWIYSIVILALGSNLGSAAELLFWLPTYGPVYVMYIFWQPLFATIWYSIVFYRHKENIKRLIKGTERKIDDKPIETSK